MVGAHDVVRRRRQIDSEAGDHGDGQEPRHGGRWSDGCGRARRTRHRGERDEEKEQQVCKWECSVLGMGGEEAAAAPMILGLAGVRLE